MKCRDRWLPGGKKILAVLVAVCFLCLTAFPAPLLAGEEGQIILETESLPCAPNVQLPAGNFDKQDALSIFNMHNSTRSQNGVATLKWNDSLYAAAQLRAQEAAVYFSHTRPNGTAFSTVHEEADGENLVYSTSASTNSIQLFNAWMNSPGHQRNILLNMYTNMAIASFTTSSRKVLVALFSTTRPAAQSLEFNLSEKHFSKAGGKVKLLPAVSPADAEMSGLLWKSTNGNVALVDVAGVVTAVGYGTCTISATTQNGKTAKCSISVGMDKKSNSSKTIKSLKLDKKKLTLTKGKKATLKVTIAPKGAKAPLKWTSSNKKVAKVNGKGRITAVGKGKCTITVSTKDGTKKATCTVQVR